MPYLTRHHGKVFICKVFLSLALSYLCLTSTHAASTHAITRDNPQPFRFGIINERIDNPQHAVDLYAPLNNYLREYLAPQAIKVLDFAITNSREEMLQLLQQGQVDLMMEGVFTTLFIQQHYADIEPALLFWRKEQRQYHTVFFVRKDSNITALSQLKGKTLVLESPRSTSAFFVPLAELTAAGISFQAANSQKRPADSNIVNYLLAGSEINQAFWVNHQRGDAAAFNNGDWLRIPERLRDQLQIIYTSRPILRWLGSFNRQTPENVRQQVTAALLSMPSNPQAQAALNAAANISNVETLTREDRETLDYWKPLLKNLRP